MVWHGDGFLRATARPAMAVLGGLTFSITPGNKGNKVIVYRDMFRAFRPHQIPIGWEGH